MLFGLKVTKTAGGVTVSGQIDLQGLELTKNQLHLIDKAFKSYDQQDLKSLQLQGQKVYPEILRILGIDMNEIDKNKNGIAFHETGIFSSKFITFALHQLELENRDSRLSFVAVCGIFS